MPKYALGLDYGTESGRVMLVDADSGAEAAWKVVPYPHGVLDRELPGGGMLAPDWALQDPLDYLYVLEQGVAETLRSAGVAGSDVVGVGVDFTASTPMPAKADGTPLRAVPELAANPHAWVKLWKHHAAEPQARRINEVARERGEAFLELYRGGYSSEWFFSKLLETLEGAPEVYAAADRYIEACDWLVWQLTGKETRSECAAGYKGMWRKGAGWPGPDYFGALDPRMRNVIAEKVEAPLIELGQAAGGLTPEWAAKLGLAPGTPVAAAVIDAHAALPACSTAKAGRLAMIMGTSICHMLLADTLLAQEAKPVEGMAGLCRDGILPGFWGYEGGQAAVGDIYGWFFRNGLTAELAEEARAKGVEPEAWLTGKAAALKPGESGLLALDWWNGCRSTLMDADLTGLIVGYSLTTRPEEIYRALIEATAFGTRHIVETFEGQGVPVEDIVACGGLAEKSPLVMQIFADVTGREMRLPRSFQASGLGAAIHGAVAAGYYQDFQTAISNMAGLQETSYRPDAAASAVYDKLYAEYRGLVDYFGRGGNDVMKRLKALRRG
jgi:L-ribulokinase